MWLKMSAFLRKIAQEQHVGGQGQRIAQEQHVGGQGQGLLLSRHGGTDVSVPKGGVVGSMMQASESPWKTRSEQERRKRTVSSCRGHGQKWSDTKGKAYPREKT